MTFWNFSGGVGGSIFRTIYSNKNFTYAKKLYLIFLSGGGIRGGGAILWHGLYPENYGRLTALYRSLQGTYVCHR